MNPGVRVVQALCEVMLMTGVESRSNEIPTIAILAKERQGGQGGETASWRSWWWHDK